MNAHQRTEALKAAIELEVFTAIGEGATTVADIAKRCNASEKGIRVLCDYLTIMEMLTKQNDHYGLTLDSSVFLDKRSPAYVGGAIDFLGSPLLAGSAKFMTDAVRKGGTVVAGGIHMSDIPSFPYALLWEERSICSVANLTRRDGAEFMELAPKVPVRAEVETFALEQANEALDRLRSGKIHGAAVLVMEPR